MQLVDGLSVVAIVEFIKRLSVRVGIKNIPGEVIMLLGAVIGAVLAFAQGSNILEGALVGAAAVGGHTIAKAVGG